MNYRFDWSIPFRSPYVDWLIHGAELTLVIAVVTTVTSLLVGLAVCTGSLSARRPLRAMAGLYIEVTRNVPGLFWIVFFYFVFPELLPEALGKPLAAYPHYAVVASLLALTVDNSPYVAEILRSSIQAVSPGQWEASAAYGFSRRQQFLFIVLPQALRTAAGPLGTRTIHNFKNTSLCMAISTPELTWATQQIESLTFRGIEATLVATGFYVFIGVTLATLVNLAERRHRFRRS